MNFGSMMAEARRLADDLDSQAYLWSDAEWLSWANEAEREACRRARLLLDSTSAECTTITLVANTATYELSDKVFLIKRAKLSGRSEVLSRVRSSRLDREAPGWEDEVGDPRAYVIDMDSPTIFRPYPTPNASGTIRLTVFRFPLCDMETNQDEPEIRGHLHIKLIHWMLFRAYSKQDAETRDEKKAQHWLAEFEREFGKPSTAIDEAWMWRNADTEVEEGNF